MRRRERLVVIGNGMAGLKFIEELVARAPDQFDIVAVGAEEVPAYNRILLSSLLAGDIGEGEVALRGRDWYARNQIELLCGKPAAEIDPKRREVRLEGGAVLPFDRLVLATGSRPIRLPIQGMNLDGVLSFRGLADVRRLVARAAISGHAAVIGGGLLGLEAAYGLARLGLGVTLIHLMDRLMERQLDERAAHLLKRAIEAKGVQARLASQVTRLVGDGCVDAVELADGNRIDADIVVVAVGIEPEKELARAAGIDCRRGIVVDGTLQTSVPSIYAIGECAEHRSICYGLVEPVYEQARVLAAHCAGGERCYSGSVAATNLKVSGIQVFSAGDFLGGDGAEEILLSDPGLPAYRKLVVRRSDSAQRLAGAVLFGDAADGLWYRDLIRSGAPIDAIRGDLIFGRDLVDAEA